MVLVTGPTGTGKSTTLAAMINQINCNINLNIITLEDPIEFVHPSQKSQVIQRELGTHLASFADGVRSAMREDPDVILVGELRDAETISMAMTAAETGHLVLSTLHTTSAVKSIDRIIDALPGDLREQTKSFLAQSLKAVVTQVLVKTPDGRGRKALMEVLVANRAISKMIMTDQSHQIRGSCKPAGTWACNSWTRCCWQPSSQMKSIRMTPFATHSTKRNSSASSPTRAFCRRSIPTIDLTVRTLV